MSGKTASTTPGDTSSTPGKIRRPRWTKAQLDILRKLYRAHSNEVIAEAVGRSVSSVVFKAHCLGLEKGIRRLREMGRENIEKRWRPRRGGRPRNAKPHRTGA